MPTPIRVGSLTCQRLGLVPRHRPAPQVIAAIGLPNYVQTLAFGWHLPERISTEIRKPATHRRAGGGGKLGQWARKEARRCTQAQPNSQRAISGTGARSLRSSTVGRPGETWPSA